MKALDDPADMSIDETAARAPAIRDAASLAVFVGLDRDGRFQIEVPEGGGPLTAAATVPLTADDQGATVLVAHVDDGRPVIIGRLYERATPVATGIVDGQRMVIRAEREIELRCGNASIVLTRAGKILIRGDYVLTRSRGANKIKGAFVEIN